ncbi:hypothetical protein Dimus_020725 [Dionaea muscipula]
MEHENADLPGMALNKYTILHPLSRTYDFDCFVVHSGNLKLIATVFSAAVDIAVTTAGVDLDGLLESGGNEAGEKIEAERVHVESDEILSHGGASNAGRMYICGAAADESVFWVCGARVDDAQEHCYGEKRVGIDYGIQSHYVNRSN